MKRLLFFFYFSLAVPFAEENLPAACQGFRSSPGAGALREAVQNFSLPLGHMWFPTGLAEDTESLWGGGD